jgi:hypothetical protein
MFFHQDFLNSGSKKINFYLFGRGGGGGSGRGRVGLGQPVGDGGAGRAEPRSRRCRRPSRACGSHARPRRLRRHGGGGGGRRTIASVSARRAACVAEAPRRVSLSPSIAAPP